MRILFILLSFLLPLQGITQYGFSHIYEMEAPGAAFHNLTIHEDTIVIGGVIKSDSLQQWGILIAMLDTLGNVLYTNAVFDSLGDDIARNQQYPIVKTADYGYVLTGNYFDRGNTFLIKFNAQGEKEFLVEYEEGGEELNFPYHVLELKDGFFILGFKSNGVSDGFIRKVDKNGEVLWEKKYGQVNQRERFASVYQVDDNTFVLGASKAGYPFISPYNFQDWAKSWIVAIDSLGTVKWQWESERFEESSIRGIQQTESGDFIYTTWDLEILDQWTLTAQTKVIKRDSNFNLLWSKKLSPIRVSGIFTYDLRSTPDDDWVALGKGPALQEDTISWFGPCLYKLTENGDSIWSVCNKIPGPYFYSDDLGGLEVLPSGSIIAAGKVNRSLPSPARSFGWLLKVTKDGCVDTLCNLIDIIHEFPSLSEDVKVYPNPVRSVLTIETQFQNGYAIRLFDLTGKTLFQKEVKNDRTVIDLTPLNLPNGMYLVEILTRSGRVVKKIMKD